MTLRLLILFMCFATLPTFATSFLATPRIHVSPLGKHFLAMLPGKDDGGFAICYALKEDGSLVRQWSLSGWYSFRVLLGCDGRTLVRIGGDGEKWDKYPDDVVLLSFYYDGLLKTSYRLSDIERLLGKSLRDAKPIDELRDENVEGELVGSFIGLSPTERMKWRFIDGSIVEFSLSGEVISVSAVTNESK